MSDDEVTNPPGEPSTENFDPEDTIKILLATDCHLGYERTTKRDQENDSLTTFEEILQLAQENEVDFILLGGDLFHETKPPQDVMSKCISLLKKYCMGTRDIKIQMLTDPELIFKDCANKTINFEDPNLNISIPVFSIHGNHDDPSSGATGSLDLLSATGLVNYFGKWTDFQKIEIPPVIIKKGNTHISLYGLSYINDKRLARLIRDGNFKMLRPTEIPDSFNMFVLHQNRVCHGLLNNLSFVKQENLPSFLDFIMWGHEHECRIIPEHVDIPDYYICQPGSSVATSLSDGETKAKHVGLLTVNKKAFKLKALKLKTVRPFVLGSVNVSKDMSELSTKSTELWPDLILKHVKDYIEFELMPQAAALLTRHPQQPTLPLIRVKVYIQAETQRFENNKISQQFCEDVANPMDIVLFLKEAKKRDLKVGHDEIAAGKFFDFNDIYDEKQWNKTVQDGITKYFAEQENFEKLTVFNVLELNDALDNFTEHDDNQAFETLVQDQKSSITEYLMRADIDFNDEGSIRTKLRDLQNQRVSNSAEDDEFRQLRRDAARRRQEREMNKTAENNDDGVNGEEEGLNTSTRGRGRGRARGGRGRGRAKTIVLDSEEEDIEEVEEVQPSRSRGKGRSRASRARGRGESTSTQRARGRAAKPTLDSFLSVTTSKKPPMKTSTTNDSIYGPARDDEFIDSD